MCANVDTYREVQSFLHTSMYVAPHAPHSMAARRLSMARPVCLTRRDSVRLRPVTPDNNPRPPKAQRFSKPKLAIRNWLAPWDFW